MRLLPGSKCLRQFFFVRIKCRNSTIIVIYSSLLRHFAPTATWILALTTSRGGGATLGFSVFACDMAAEKSPLWVSSLSPTHSSLGTISKRHFSRNNVLSGVFFRSSPSVAHRRRRNCFNFSLLTRLCCSCGFSSLILSHRSCPIFTLNFTLSKISQSSENCTIWLTEYSTRCRSSVQFCCSPPYFRHSLEIQSRTF